MLRADTKFHVLSAVSSKIECLSVSLNYGGTVRSLLHVTILVLRLPHHSVVRAGARVTPPGNYIADWEHNI